MATTTLRDGSNAVLTHAVTGSFTDVITSIPAAASVAGLLRNLQSDNIIVVKGGSVVPADGSQGEVLGPNGAVYCETDHIWVRATDGGSLVCFETF